MARPGRTESESVPIWLKLSDADAAQMEQVLARPEFAGWTKAEWCLEIIQTALRYYTKRPVAEPSRERAPERPAASEPEAQPPAPEPQLAASEPELAAREPELAAREPESPALRRRGARIRSAGARIPAAEPRTGSTEAPAGSTEARTGSTEAAASRPGAGTRRGSAGAGTRRTAGDG